MLRASFVAPRARESRAVQTRAGSLECISKGRMSESARDPLEIHRKVLFSNWRGRSSSDEAEGGKGCGHPGHDEPHKIRIPVQGYENATRTRVWEKGTGVLRCAQKYDAQRLPSLIEFVAMNR